MKKSILILFALLSILFYGCPYDSTVALCEYEEAMKKDKKTFGKWWIFHEGGAHNELIISKGDKWVMHVQNREYDENNEKINDHYHRAFAIEIKGEVFYNIEKKDSTHNYYRFEWKNEDKDEFVLYGVKDSYMNERSDEVEGLDSEGMVNFIKKHMDKPEFFDEPLHAYRVDSDPFEEKKKEWKEE